MKKDRFIKVYSQNSLFGCNERILVDVETGVNYLFCTEGFGCGLILSAKRNVGSVVNQFCKKNAYKILNFRFLI